ncbi:MAG: DinB family protein [Caldilineaceae bacterium]
MSKALPVLRHTRNSIYKAVKDLTPEQCLAIPGGHDNNIAWNIGHIITVQQRLCYVRCGLDPYISSNMMALYLPGTSPADWNKQPDSAGLIAMMMEHMDKLEADYADGKFDTSFEATTTPSGLFIGDFETALIFNIYHESQHFGTILALKNFVG